jgi:hypothetical protein
VPASPAWTVACSTDQLGPERYPQQRSGIQPERSCVCADPSMIRNIAGAALPLIVYGDGRRLVHDDMTGEGARGPSPNYDRITAGHAVLLIALQKRRGVPSSSRSFGEALRRERNSPSTATPTREVTVPRARGRTAPWSGRAGLARRPWPGCGRCRSRRWQATTAFEVTTGLSPARLATRSLRWSPCIAGQAWRHLQDGLDRRSQSVFLLHLCIHATQRSQTATGRRRP